MDWDTVKKRFDVIREQHKYLDERPDVITTFALRLTFDPLAKRYDAGERTQELFSEMMNVE